MSEKAAGHHAGLPLAGLQLWQKVVTVEVVKLLQVTEDDPSLAPEVLGDAWSVQQGEVVGQDVAQRAHVLPLCEQQLLQDSLQPPVTEQISTNFKRRLLLTRHYTIYSIYIQRISYNSSFNFELMICTENKVQRQH